MGTAAVAGVFALAVFAHDDPVEFLWVLLAGRQGGGDPAQDSCWADVGVLLEGLADCETQAPEGDVVGDTLVPNCAKKNSVVCFEGGEAVFGDVVAGGFVGGAGPVVMCEGEGESLVGRGESLEDFNSGGDDFGADAVRRYTGD